MALLAILAAGAAVMRAALDVSPFAWENLYSLTVAVDSKLWNLMTDSTGPEPTYRPVPYVSIWLQGKLFDIDARAYLAFNAGCWVACAMALYALVFRLSRSYFASLAVGLALLVDSRAYVLLTWIDERQTSLAVLCGLLALLVLTVPEPRRWPVVRQASVFALLLMSALSKEYGLAFSGAAVIFALASLEPQLSQESRRSVVRMACLATAVVGAYLVLRLTLAGHTFGLDFCSDQSFFRVRINETVCLSQMDTSTKAAQFGYNSAATLIGTLMPSLFSSNGATRWPQVPWYFVSWSIAVAVFAVVALIKSPRQVWAPLSLIVFQAALSFMLYRPRNQLTGAAGLYTAAGVGLGVLMNQARASRTPQALRAAIILPVMLALALHGQSLLRALDEERLDALKREPCRHFGDRALSRDVIRRVKHIYALNNPNCE